MAYDAANGTIVLFGGFVENEGSGTFLSDTWVWNGTTWTRERGAGPSARVDASMAYDPATSTIVLFGGIGAGGTLSDTWSWNGTTWSELSPAVSPPARDQAAMAYDSATSNMVLFGGVSGASNSVPLGDTWVWNGTTWAEQSPATSPPARAPYNAVAYDPTTGDVVIFGGGTSSSYLADTWVWNGSTWTQQFPATSPPARDSATMDYDPANSNVVLFGGGANNDFSDTWILTYPAMSTQLSTSLSGDSQSGSDLNVPPSTPVSDSATLTGNNASSAGGSVTYSVYSDNECSDLVASGGTETVSAGVVPSSSSVSLSAAGTYYWQASYSGDTYNDTSVSPCGSEVETVSAPGIGIVKTASISGYSAAGTPVTYSYKVTNTGNVTLNPVMVSDPMVGLSTISCPGGSLAAGAIETCMATYTTTQADVNAGSITNTGTATGTPPSGPNVSATSMVTIPLTPAPAITLTKSASISGYSAAGTPVTYSYKVTNTGNVTLNPVMVSDPMVGLSTISCPGGSLAAGAIETCMATYTTTQADVNAGSITNTGTATGTPPSGPNVSATSMVTIPLTPAPAITLTKSASISGYSAAGTPVTYSYKVTNTGNVTLNPVMVSDPMVGLSTISCPGGSLAAGAIETCMATYTTTQADVNAGSITNTGTATGTPPSGPNVSATSMVTIPLTPAPAITLTKTASISGYSAAGTPVTYSYKVTNTGNVTLNPVMVSDPMVGLSTISCPGGSLAAGAIETCMATYTTTQADVNAGSITNTGTATGTPPSGPNVSATSMVTIPLTPAPAITLTKSASISGYSAAGTPVTYSYKVTNTGNVTLNPVMVSDPMVGLSTISCPGGSLAAGAIETCMATYTTTQADVNAGSITNTGTATGTPPSGPNVSATSMVTIPLTPAPAITLTKSASISGYSAAGTPVTYSYKVTNTGNVTLNPVMVSDPMVGLSTISCPGGSLAAGAIETCMATYTTTQADVNAGSITNTGTATGTPPSGPNVSATSMVTIPLTPAPAITLTKSASISGYSAAGTPVTYSYKVTNTGNVTLNPVMVSDPMVGLSTISCPGGSLAAGAIETCMATYTTTQADVNAGSITNTGTATGTPPSGPNVSATSMVTIPLTPAPAITLTKSASISGYSAAGTPVTYSYKVTNTGNVTLNPVMVSDPMVGLSTISCPGGSLAAGAIETCMATYTTTQADVNAGSITNTGTATGTPPSGPNVSATSMVTIPASGATSSLSLTKSTTSSGYSAAGQTLSYNYLVTNTGTTTISSIGVSDNKVGPGQPDLPTVLPGPGRQRDLHRDLQHHPDRRGHRLGDQHRHRQRQEPPGHRRHLAHLDGDGDRSGGEPLRRDREVNQRRHQRTVHPGGLAGHLELRGDQHRQRDPHLGHRHRQQGGILGHQLRGRHQRHRHDGPGCIGGLHGHRHRCRRCLLQHRHRDRHPAGRGNLGVVSLDGSYFGSNPSITLTKSASISSFSATGTPVTYSYKVTNTGNVTLNPVTVTDPMTGLSAITCPATSLAAGAGETCTATYTTTQADVNAGSITNTGTATGTPPSAPT